MNVKSVYKSFSKALVSAAGKLVIGRTALSGAVLDTSKQAARDGILKALPN